MTKLSARKFDAILKGKFPRLKIGSWPTPLEIVKQSTPQLSNGPLMLIKRDDLSHPVYGGNKARKLEYILADALHRGCQEIITAGGLGSHHVLAAAALGREVGLKTTGLFFCQPINGHVRQNLLLESSFGTDMHFVRDYPGLVKGYLKFFLSRRFSSGCRPYLLMPGGSTPLSTLGYINAALEIKEQLDEQGLPAPRAVFTAAGTGGTAAGLLAGFALLGMDTKLHAVRVVHPSVLKKETIIRLAHKSLKLLAGLGLDTAAAQQRLPFLLQFVDGYLGEGYGFATTQAVVAKDWFKENAGLELEGCYTAKAAAAFLDYCPSVEEDSAPVLFIHTASTTHLAHAGSLPSGADLPSAFQWCIEGKACPGHCSLRKRNRSFCDAAGRDGWRWL